MIVRSARPRDVVRFCRVICPRHFIGVVAEEDGELLGAGWVVWGDKGRPWVCLEDAGGLTRHPVAIGRWSRRLVRAAQLVCHELYAIEDMDDLGSSRWLEWLGFLPTNEMCGDKRVLKWQKHSLH